MEIENIKEKLSCGFWFSLPEIKVTLKQKNGYKKEASWNDFDYESKERSIVRTWKR